MNWLQRYRLRHYLRNSIWVLPVFAMFTAMALARALHWLDLQIDLVSVITPENLRAALGTLAGSMFTLIVFVCSSLLLVVQLASAQLTPRMIGVLFQDMVTKITLSMFVFSFALCLSTLVRVGETVPVLSGRIAAWTGVLCVGSFLYLVDHVGKLLRPSGALQTVSARAHRIIDSVYPRRLKDRAASRSESAVALPKGPARTVSSKRAGVVLTFDVRGLVALAARHDCLIELAPQVGDFVAPGNTLFRIYGDADPSAHVLRRSVAIGAERTMEQDPALAFRLIVDIASKGLSPAINDPTTAVLAIDRIHHLLRHVGSRHLDDERVHDASGRVRLIYRTPNWEDFLVLAVTEIRQFGGTSVQIARRLRAMLEDLIKSLPEERAAALRKELVLLKKSTERYFQEPEDRALADIGDSQGVGGAPYVGSDALLGSDSQ